MKYKRCGLYEDHLEMQEKIGVEFANDKYRSLYNLPYNKFIVQLIKSEGDILNSSIQTVTSFIADCGNLEDIMGISGMLDKMSKDGKLIDVNANTVEVRKRVHYIFTEKIKELIGRGILIEEEVSSKVTEAAFFRISALVYCDTLEGLSQEQDRDQQKKQSSSTKKSASGAWWIVLVCFIIQNVFQIGRESPTTIVEYGLVCAYSVGVMIPCFVPSLIITILVRLATGKWLSSRKFAYGVIGVFIVSLIGSL